MIVSAMSGETNRLLALAHEISPTPDMREMDSLASTGEQVSAALVAMTIQKMGGKAKSFLGHQIRIQTDDAFHQGAHRQHRGFAAAPRGDQRLHRGGRRLSGHRAGPATSRRSVAAAPIRRRRHRRGHQGRRLRDLYGRGRRLHDRSQHLSGGA